MTWQWRLIQRECTGCGICGDVCTYGAIAMGRLTAYPEGVPGACVGCMMCVEQCPFAAIEVLPPDPPTGSTGPAAAATRERA
ncbi:MAG: 4Fe-4S dicluster domain-containing protein [Thermoguttaceae bacterium]|jgi:MinD superfamily P-loop ATPase